MKKMFKVLFIISLLFVFCVISYSILSNMGFFCKNINVYEFVGDMNNDGENEKVKFSNRYTTHDNKAASDDVYTINYIKIYIDGKMMFNKKITTLSPLINPKVLDIDGEGKKKQIFVHDNGGGPAIPMDYYFYMENEKIVVSKYPSS